MARPVPQKVRPLLCQVLQERQWRIYLTTSIRGHTVRFNLASGPFDDFAKLGPSREVLEVEADPVCLGQMIEVARVELEQVRRCHGSDQAHVFVTQGVYRWIEIDLLGPRSSAATSRLGTRKYGVMVHMTD